MPNASPFDLLIEGAKALIQQQEAAAGLTNEEYRQQSLDRFYAAEELPIETQTPESTAINSYAYNARDLTLRLEWVGGRQYLYYGVSEVYKEGLDAATSIGTYVNQIIKAGYFPFTRLS